jgi:uncharacterized protein YaeQ
MWWDNNKKALLKQNNLTVINLPDTQEIADIASRGMAISCTIQDKEIMLGHATGSVEIKPVILK